MVPYDVFRALRMNSYPLCDMHKPQVLYRLGRHVTIYTPSDKLEARRHTIDAIQLTPVNLQNLLLNSEDFLWAP